MPLQSISLTMYVPASEILLLQAEPPVLQNKILLRKAIPARSAYANEGGGGEKGSKCMHAWVPPRLHVRAQMRHEIVRIIQISEDPRIGLILLANDTIPYLNVRRLWDRYAWKDEKTGNTL